MNSYCKPSYSERSKSTKTLKNNLKMEEKEIFFTKERAIPPKNSLLEGMLSKKKSKSRRLVRVQILSTMCKFSGEPCKENTYSVHSSCHSSVHLSVHPEIWIIMLLTRPLKPINFQLLFSGQCCTLTLENSREAPTVTSSTHLMT